MANKEKNLQAEIKKNPVDGFENSGMFWEPSKKTGSNYKPTSREVVLARYGAAKRALALVLSKIHASKNTPVNLQPLVKKANKPSKKAGKEK